MGGGGGQVVSTGGDGRMKVWATGDGRLEAVKEVEVGEGKHPINGCSGGDGGQGVVIGLGLREGGGAVAGSVRVYGGEGGGGCT